MLHLLVAAALTLPADIDPDAGAVILDAEKYLDPFQADYGFQQAIDEVARRGGGIVKLPPGQFELRRGLVLRDWVELAGAGIGTTVLRPQRQVERLEVLSVREHRNKACTVYVDHIPLELRVGSAVVACEQFPFPPPERTKPRPCIVTAIHRVGNWLTLKAPYGICALEPGKGCLMFGDAAALERDVHKGDMEIALRDASLFRRGDQLTLGAPGNEILAHAFVREVYGNTLILEAPVQIDFPAWPAADTVGATKVDALVFAVFPMLHGADLHGSSVSDLTIQGRGFARAGTTQNRWSLSGIHLYNATEVRVERVAVHDWPADGISLQAGTRCKVANCVVTGSHQNGIHPGTGLTNSLFLENVCQRNNAGFYFCWDNVGHVVRGNEFTENDYGGIVGLGNPRDASNLIEENVVARNGRVGIEINGGGQSNNVLRANTVEDNSQKFPGQYAGISLYSLGDGAQRYQIVKNVIRDTQRVPTQHIGVAEEPGADGNTVKDNTFSGHERADVIVAGKNTKVEGSPGAKVRRWQITKPARPKAG